MENTIERTYGDIRVVISTSDHLGYLERLSTDESIIFHLEADFYREPETWDSGFSMRQADDGWLIRYSDVNPDGSETEIQRFELSQPEYDQVNRFFMRYRSGQLV